MARLRDRYKSEVTPNLVKQFNYKNVMQVPKLEKIVVNMGLGETINNNKLIQQANEQMMAISYDELDALGGAGRQVADEALRNAEQLIGLQEGALHGERLAGRVAVGHVDGDQAQAARQFPFDLA